MPSRVHAAPVRSVREFLDAAVPPAAGALLEGRGHPPRVFRGMRNEHHALLTSLDRLGMEESGKPHRGTMFEKDLLAAFIRRSRSHLPQRPENPWEYRALAQHYGLPTRLLDWTFSPLVALWFAVKEAPGEASAGARPDAAVWALDWVEMHRRFGWETHPYDAEALLHRLGGGQQDWGATSPAADPFAALFLPPAMDGRISAQSGAFTVASETGLSFDEFLRASGMGHVLRKVTIAQDARRDLLAELDGLGVHEESLFPGLDGVARSIRARYSEMARQGFQRGMI